MKSSIDRGAEPSLARKAGMPIALYALAISAFAIGTTEFVIMGLLPNVADDLHVSIPQAGLLVTGYALGVVVGAPGLTALTTRMPRKALLLALMGLFVVGNLLCAVAPGYGMLMAARVVTALAHGAFFGVGSVIAAELVPADKRAAAIALMFTGSTLANILGVPLGTLLGQHAGWRATFWAVTALGILAVIGTAALVPRVPREGAPSLRQEIGVLRRPQVLLALLMTVLGYGGVFTVFTYIAPLLERVTGYSPTAVSLLLVLFGAGLLAGNTLGGKLADWRLIPSLLGILALLAAVLAAFTVTSHNQVAAAVTVFLFGAAAFGTVPPLQLRVVDKAKDAPNIASAFNIAAFNLGNAGGAFLGGLVAASRLGLNAVTWVGALVTVGGIVATAWSGLLDRRAAGEDAAAREVA